MRIYLNEPINTKFKRRIICFIKDFKEFKEDINKHFTESQENNRKRLSDDQVNTIKRLTEMIKTIGFEIIIQESFKY